jgi:large subunit ribosomal protein L15
MRLNEISDNKGATHARKRIGRGSGSGMGKTATKGHKGQKARSGVAVNGFEGGQMPLYRRVPKRGFTNIFRKRYVELNIGRLQDAIDAGRVDAKKPISGETLVAAGILRRIHDGVRLLAKGEISANVTIEVAGASKSAVEAVEKAGGKVVLPPKDDAPRGLPLPRLPRLPVVLFLGLAVYRPGALGAAWSTWSRNDFHRTWTVHGEADSWVHGRSKAVPPYYTQNNYSSTSQRGPTGRAAIFCKKNHSP